MKRRFNIYENLLMVLFFCCAESYAETVALGSFEVTWTVIGVEGPTLESPSIKPLPSHIGGDSSLACTALPSVGETEKFNTDISYDSVTRTVEFDGEAFSPSFFRNTGDPNKPIFIIESEVEYPREYWSPNPEVSWVVTESFQLLYIGTTSGNQYRVNYTKNKVLTWETSRYGEFFSHTIQCKEIGQERGGFGVASPETFNIIQSIQSTFIKETESGVVNEVEGVVKEVEWMGSSSSDVRKCDLNLKGIELETIVNESGNESALFSTDFTMPDESILQWLYLLKGDITKTTIKFSFNSQPLLVLNSNDLSKDVIEELVIDIDSVKGQTGELVIELESTSTIPSNMLLIKDLSEVNCNSFTWDIDGDGETKPLTDGLLMLRYQFGFRGEALIADAVGSGASRTSESEIEAFLATGDIQMDIDGDGNVQPLTDGLLLLRYLFGFRGDTLIDNAVSSGATRSNAEGVASYIETILPR